MENKKPLVVIAIGGNALLKENQKGTIAEQDANVENCSEQLAKILNNDYQLLITHGNGPQVGLIMLRDSYHGAKRPPVPLYIYNAESQGQIGYQLMNGLSNKLAKKHSADSIVAILTRVAVHADDPAFQNPTKPVGSFYSIEEIDALAKAYDFKYIEDSGRGYRKIVASPKPIEIVEIGVIQDMLKTGRSLIAAGGGGIPVVKAPDGTYAGVDAVIDKDLSSALLAKQVGADILMILTGVEQVAINFNKPTMQQLRDISVAEAKKYLNEGHFPAGSMEPKMLAAIDFAESTGKKAIITSLEKASEALQGLTGTSITR